MSPSLSASSSALVPAKSTLQQRVLSEEAYTSTISDLIRRDFFPQLERLEAENAYLDALTLLDEPGGEERLERAVRRLVGHEIRAGIVPPTPRAGNTGKGRQREATVDLPPRDYYFDETTTPRIDSQGRGEWDPTPLPHQEATPLPIKEADEEDLLEQTPPLNGLTLSSFQAQYTSEDNASFLEILKANEAKRKEKYKWAYDAERNSNEKRTKALMASQLQAKAGFQASLEKAPHEIKRRIEAGIQPKLITSNGQVGQSDTVDFSIENEQQLPLIGMAEISPALEEAKSLQSWSHTNRNALFFGPDASRSTHSQRTSSLPLSKKATFLNMKSIFGDEVLEDRAPGINFRNTRLLDDDDDLNEESKGSETPRSSRIDAAIGGWADTASSAGDSTTIGNIAIPSSPRVAGYSFVSPLPSPRPGDLGEERIRQLMTWGTVIGTPRAVGDKKSVAIIDEDQYDGSFRIPPTPNRDLLARRLADKTGESNRKRSSAVPLMRSSTKRKSRVDLSPAGQTLLDRTRRGGSGLSSLGKSLLSSKSRDDLSSTRLKRERWTPSPSPKR